MLTRATVIIQSPRVEVCNLLKTQPGVVETARLAVVGVDRIQAGIIVKITIRGIPITRKRTQTCPQIKAVVCFSSYSADSQE